MLVFYLAAIDSDESKNKFEYIYHKYYRFMLRTASSIIRDTNFHHLKISLENFVLGLDF